MKSITTSTYAAVVTSMIFALPVSAMSMQGSMMISGNVMMGSHGTDVSSLQTFLESKGFLTLPGGVAHGHFGGLTRRALMSYQSSVGIRATGFFGPLTRAAYMKDAAMMSDSSMMHDSGTMAGGAQVGVMVGGALMTPDLDIVQNAVHANNVTTVVAAVKAAGLVDTLESAGPFTVFAPTNDAFAKLPAGTVDTLVKPENKATLTDILTYHVVAGRYTSADLTDGLVLKTVEGKTLTFHKDAAGHITINGKAMVQTADVISRNGVTHVIDTVLSPADGKYADVGVEVGGALMVRTLDIVDNAVNAGNVTTVVAAVKAAGLVATLKGAGPFTVFAPDNAAFAKLPAGTVETLVKPENKATLTDILTYHVVAGRYTTNDLYDGQILTTVEGKTLKIHKVGAQIWINGSAMIETPNVISSNGVTHVIDTVLMPSAN